MRGNRGEDGRKNGERASSRWLWTALVAALLLVGSAIPLPSHRPHFGRFGPDKLLHVVGHAWLATALVAALDEEGDATSAAVLAVVASTLYGVGTELLQEAVPGREFEREDVIAGVVGSIVGVMGWRRLTACVRSR